MNQINIFETKVGILFIFVEEQVFGGGVNVHEGGSTFNIKHKVWW